MVCDPENLQSELDFLWTIFLQNGYGTDEFAKVKGSMENKEEKAKQEEVKGLAVIPCLGAILGKIGHLLKKHGIPYQINVEGVR